VMALANAKLKLEGKFALENLPADVVSPLWDKIAAKFSLELEELSALQNERCKAQGSQNLDQMAKDIAKLTESIDQLSAVVTSKSSHTSTRRERAGKADVEKRDKTCCVSGENPSRCKAAHIVERRLAETLHVPTENIDDANNRILFINALEETYGSDEWCFDTDGVVKILFQHTRVKHILMAANLKVRLVSEAHGGPAKANIRIALQHKLRMAARRCPDCFLVRDDIALHRKISCQGALLYGASSDGESKSASLPTSTTSLNDQGSLASTVCKRITFFGKLHGVGFRANVVNLAKQFGITGSIRSLDGVYLVIAQGRDLDLFFAACMTGFQIQNTKIEDVLELPNFASFAVYGKEI